MFRSALLLALGCRAAPAPMAEPFDVVLRAHVDAPCEGLVIAERRRVAGEYRSWARAGNREFFGARDHIVERSADGTLAERYLPGRLWQLVWAGGALWTASGRTGVLYVPDGDPARARVLDADGDVVTIVGDGTQVWAANTAGTVFRWSAESPDAPTRTRIDGTPGTLVTTANGVAMLQRPGWLSLSNATTIEASAAVSGHLGLVHAQERSLHLPSGVVELDAPAHLLADVEGHLYASTTNSLQRIDDDGQITTLAPNPGEHILQLVVEGDRILALAGRAGALELIDGAWVPLLRGGWLTTLDADGEGWLATAHAPDGAWALREDGREIPLPSVARDLLRRGDHWLIATEEHGVQRLDAGELSPYAAAHEPTASLDGAPSGPWTLLTHTKGLRSMQGRESVQSYETDLPRPIGAVWHWDDGASLIYLVASRVDRYRNGLLAHSTPLPSTHFNLRKPARHARQRRRGDHGWLAMPTWGLSTSVDAGESWRHHRLHPGVWDTLPQDDATMLAMGAAGLGVFVDDTLQNRCDAPGSTTAVTRSSTGLWTASSGVLTRWAPTD